MNIEQYERLALRTLKDTLDFKDKLVMAALGCTGESGEIAEIVKKHLYHGHILDHADLKKELGDLLWYLSLMAHLFGWTLSEIGEANIAKLAKRYPDKFTDEASMNRLE